MAHNKEDCEAFFDNKIKFAFENLPIGLQKAFKAKTDTKRELKFKNGSVIRVGTSLRSSTNQFLLISEFGKQCAQSPDRAKETVSGSLNTVSDDNMVVIESTAEGADNYFHKFCMEGLSNLTSGKELTKMDWQFFFFPWWKEGLYKLENADVFISEDMKLYFGELETEHGIKLDESQKMWYIKKLNDLGEDMFREFPSTPEEAFSVSNEGKYYSKQLVELRERGQVIDFEPDPFLDVNCVWDLGFSDCTAIIFYQQHGPNARIIDYYENSNEGLEHYVNIINHKYNDNDWKVGENWLPHDVRVTELGSGLTRLRQLQDLGLHVSIVEKLPLAEGIEAVRQLLPNCWFRRGTTELLLKHLATYRKKFSKQLGTFTDRPVHDKASHAADSMRYLSYAFRASATSRTAMPVQELMRLNRINARRV